jgi:sec-independent protein translocase protein TatB
VFDSIGWGEIVVLVVAGLFILGPERLPAAAAWTGKAIRQVREFATGAREQLRGELGPEFDELRKPLEELRGLRNFNPRTAVTRTLFDEGVGSQTNGHTTSSPATPAAPPPAQEKLAQNERPPIDPDAT